MYCVTREKSFPENLNAAKQQFSDITAFQRLIGGIEGTQITAHNLKTDPNSDVYFNRKRESLN